MHGEHDMDMRSRIISYTSSLTAGYVVDQTSLQNLWHLLLTLVSAFFAGIVAPVAVQFASHWLRTRSSLAAMEAAQAEADRKLRDSHTQLKALQDRIIANGKVPPPDDDA